MPSRCSRPFNILTPHWIFPIAITNGGMALGTPRGLSKESSPRLPVSLPWRIFGDALQTDRPYRDAWSEAEAADYIKKLSGKQFDPQVIKAFFELVDLS